MGAYFVLKQGFEFTVRSRVTKRPFHFYADKPVHIPYDLDVEYLRGQCRNRKLIVECDKDGKRFEVLETDKGRFPHALSVKATRQPENKPDKSEILEMKVEKRQLLEFDITKLNVVEAKKVVASSTDRDILLAHKKMENERIDRNPRSTLIAFIDEMLEESEEKVDGQDWK